MGDKGPGSKGGGKKPKTSTKKKGAGTTTRSSHAATNSLGPRAGPSHLWAVTPPAYGPVFRRLSPPNTNGSRTGCVRHLVPSLESGSLSCAL